MGRLLDEDDVINAFAELLAERCGGNRIWWEPAVVAIVNNLPPVQNLKEVCAYLELCVEEAKDKAWGEGISFALCFIKKLLSSVQPTQIDTSNTLKALNCVERQAAIDALSQYPFEKVVNCISIIEELSSAQPERKTGKWIEQDDGWDGVYYECSRCKEAFTLIDGTPSDNLYNFCPNCGADMRGV